MAAPAEIKLDNLNGDFVMNKTLSDEFEPILSLQGVGWVTRKAITMATITLKCKTYVDEKGVTNIDIDQIGTGGMKGTSEKRHLDNEEGEHQDQIFGKVKGRSRWIALSEVTEPWMKEGWLPEMTEGDTKMVQSYVESQGNGWTADQIWGFADINGERRYVRRAIVRKGKEEKRARLVYDYRSK